MRVRRDGAGSMSREVVGDLGRFLMVFECFGHLNHLDSFHFGRGESLCHASVTFRDEIESRLALKGRFLSFLAPYG